MKAIVSDRGTTILDAIVARVTKPLSLTIFFLKILFASLASCALVNLAFAEVLTDEPSSELPYRSLVHLALTVLGVILAARLAAAAFARPNVMLNDIAISPRYLTGRGDYQLGLILFVVLIAFIFMFLVHMHRKLISVLGHFLFLPETLSKEVFDAVYNETVPYLLVVCFIAVLFLYLLYKEAEWNILLMLRDVLHIWIGIPTRVRSIVAQMMFPFAIPKPFAREIVNAQVGVRGEDFEKDPTTFERQWAELSYIQLWLTRQLGSSEAGFFDDAEFKLDALQAEYAGLSADVVRLREDQQSHAADARALVPRARALRSSLARAVCCYLIFRHGVNDRLDDAAREFGLPIRRASVQNPLKYIAIYLIAFTFCVYFAVYVSAVGYDLLGGLSPAKALSNQNDPLLWRWIAICAINYGLPIVVILFVRYIGWTTSTKSSYLVTYCWTALAAIVVAALGLTIATGLERGFTEINFIALFAARLKWGLGPAIITVFISYCMDRQTSSALPDIDHSRGSVGWRIAMSLVLGLIVVLVLLSPLLSLPSPVVGDWSAEKLHVVGIGSNFFMAFGLALPAQFALRKPQNSTAEVPEAVPTGLDAIAWATVNGPVESRGLRDFPRFPESEHADLAKSKLRELTRKVAASARDSFQKHVSSATAGSRAPAQSAPERRHINAWIEDGAPPLRVGRLYRLGVNIGRLRDRTIAAALFAEPKWQQEAELELLVVIGGSDFSAEPRSTPLRVRRSGDTAPIFFDVTPLRGDRIVVRISFYLARELALLQEFEVPIATREAENAA